MRVVISGLFVALLLLSLLFTMERMLFADAPFILFRIINQDVFQIQELRYGSFITQLFPLAAVSLHIPLKGIIFLYSASFNVFYLVVAMLLLFRFRNNMLALLMCFYYVLFVSDTFYWSNNEVHQGIAWMFLLFASIRFKGQKKIAWPMSLIIFTLLAFLTIFTHPLLIFPVAFLWIFFLLNNELKITGKEKLIYSAILLGICLFKLALSRSQSYDGQKLEGLMQLKGHISLNTWLNAFRSPMIVQFLKRLVTNYWISIPIIITGLYFGLEQKKYYAIGLVVLFAMVYMFALGITYNDFEAFYSESEWMPLSIIITAPFAWYVFPRMSPKIASYTFAIVFIVRLAYIYDASGKFTARKDWYQAALDTMRQQQQTKAIIPETSEIKKKLLLTWAAPVESLILSALNKDKPTRTFIVSSPDQANQIQNTEKNQVLVPFETLNYTQLNHFYFSPDTTFIYTPLNLSK